MIVLFVVLLTSLVFLLFMFLRNECVYEERFRILDIVSELAKEDIETEKAFAWRYEELDSISYNKMVWQFWKPIKSFYAQSKCIKN